MNNRHQQKEKGDNMEDEKPMKRRAIIVKATGNLSYADTSRKMQADTKLEALGSTVSKIRRTQERELLIQLKSGDNSTTEFQKGIVKLLKGSTDDHRTQMYVNEETTAADIAKEISLYWG